LGVKTQLPAPLVSGAVAIAHHVRPDLARRAVFGDLFEEVVMSVEEEAQPPGEIVDSKAALQCPVDVLDAVAQGKRKFLLSGGPRFANVIPANGNGIEAW